MPSPVKVLRYQAEPYFDQPRREIKNVCPGFAGVFFCLANKQFVLIINQETGEELCVSMIKDGYWERIT